MNARPFAVLEPLLPRDSLEPQLLSPIVSKGWVTAGEPLAPFVQESLEFANPVEGESGSFASRPAESSVGYAERYGGFGMGGHQGGARCANINGWQLKGVGPNSLVCQSEPYWQRFGGLTFREAARDLVWGRVCREVLPFRSPRVLGFYLVGTRVPRRYRSRVRPELATTPRVVLVREPILRLGHAVRPVITRIDGTVIQKANASVRSMAAQLGHHFERLGMSRDSLHIEDGIRELAARLGKQAAFCRSRRLVHGALSPSNLGLGAEILDFGVCSAVSDHGRFIVARRTPDAWGQQSLVCRSLVEFCGALNRAYGRPAVVPSEISKVYWDSFYQNYAKAMLELAGFPPHFMRDVPTEPKNRLSRSILGLLRLQYPEPFKLLHPCDNYAPSMPSATGALDIGAVLFESVLPSSPGGLARALMERGLSWDGLDEFVAAFWTVRRLVLAMCPAGTVSKLLQWTALNSARVNSQLEHLYSNIFDDTVDELEDDLERASAVFAEAIELGTNALSEATADGFVLRGREGIIRVSLDGFIGADGRKIERGGVKWESFFRNREDIRRCQEASRFGGPI